MPYAQVVQEILLLLRQAHVKILLRAIAALCLCADHVRVRGVLSSGGGLELLLVLAGLSGHLRSGLLVRLLVRHPPQPPSKPPPAAFAGPRGPGSPVRRRRRRGPAVVELCQPPCKHDGLHSQLPPRPHKRTTVTQRRCIHTWQPDTAARQAASPGQLPRLRRQHAAHAGWRARTGGTCDSRYASCARS